MKLEESPNLHTFEAALPYLIRTDPKDPRGERIQIVVFGEPTPIPDYCICDGCKNSAGCSWKPLKPPYTTCIDYKVNREVKQ